MPGTHNKPMMAHGNKPKSAGLKALAKKNPELEYVGKAKMMDIRAKMAMPKMVDSSNFPKMAQEMAMAMDYNSSKPMMYGGDKPKMMSKDGKHTGKVVNIGGKNYDTRSSEYRALQKKIQKQEKQEVQIKGGRYTGRSQSGTTQMS
tara:strand:- start:325 stop:762 length:438 start_codon:yes stop_codon:yes gene_type:complete